MKILFSNCPPCLLAEMAKMASLVTKLYSEVNIASYDELFDQSECPILIFTSGNKTD